MAGVKGKCGGARKGAGRKPIPSIEQPLKPNDKYKNFNAYYNDMPKCDIELTFPEELKGIPYAEDTWDYVIEIDKQSSVHLLNARHAEALKSFCIEVAMRRLLIEEWEKNGRAMIAFTAKGEIKMNPIIMELDRKNKQINLFAEDLGLTVLGEFKLAKEAKTSPTLLNDTEENKEDDDDGMFD